VLAIKGDDSMFKKPIPEGRSSNAYAFDLVKQIKAMNRGRYLEEDLMDAAPTNFCIGVGGYPEKHFSAPNIGTDIRYVKEKVEAGADYIVTQMFFNNKYYFDYVDKCREAGITVPIIPGLKLITAKRQLKSIPSNFFVEIPEELTSEVMKAKPEHTIDVGVEWALKQCEELLDKGVPLLHFYIMQNSGPIDKLFDKFIILFFSDCVNILTSNEFIANSEFRDS
jgi:methylenetetrahydrofolate reductase (NADPH)